VSADNGVALLGGHNLDTDDQSDVKYVSRLITRNIVKEQLVKGDVLISSAGTVGLYDFVWGNHEGKLASQHILRIRAKEGRVQPGYLYAYLSSPLALSMITNQSAGSIIVTLYTEHLAELSLPRLSARLESLIHVRIVQSFSCRSECRELLQETRSSAVEANALAPLPDETEEEPECLGVPSGLAATGEHRLDAHFYNAAANLAVVNIRKSRSEVKTVADVAQVIFTGGRLKRNYVESTHGVPFLSGKNIIQIRPTGLKYLSNLQMADLDELILKRECTLITRSGTIGRTCFVWRNYEDYAASEDVLRAIPDESKIDPGYLYAFLSSRYGYEQILRYRHGSVIDHVTDTHIENVVVPCPSREEQTAIGDKVREAYEKRAEAIRLEDEAQAILMKELTKAPGTKGT
jgi:type I restriction enzyme S subunit